MGNVWAVYVIGIIFAICFLRGILKGGVGIAVGTCIMAISFIVATIFMEDVSKKIVEVTSLDQRIASKYDAFLAQIMDEEIREIFGKDIDKAIIGERLDYDALGVTKEEFEEMMDEIQLSREEEIEKIKNIEIPESLKKSLMENNNAITYEKLGVNTFSEYISAFVARTIANTLAFIGIFMVSTVVLKIIACIFIEIPIKRHLGGLNRMLGGVLGLFEGLIICWIVITMIVFLAEIGFDDFASQIEGIYAFEPTRIIAKNNLIRSLIWKVM